MAQQKNDIVDMLERKLAVLYKERGTDLWSPIDFEIDRLRARLHSALEIHIEQQGLFNGRETESTPGLPTAYPEGPEITPAPADDEPR